MFANLNGWHLLIVLAVILLIFGATRLPALARGVGQSLRILRTEVVDPDRPRATTATEPDARPTGDDESPRS